MLFQAVCGRNLDIVAALMLHSADPDLSSGRGMLVSDLADPQTTTLLDLFQGNFADKASRRSLEELGDVRRRNLSHLERYVE